MVLARIFVRDCGALRANKETCFVYVTAVCEQSNKEIGQIAKPVSFRLYDQVTKRTRWMPWR